MLEKTAFNNLLNNPEHSLSFVKGICKQHHLPTNLTKIDGGSRILYASGDHYVIKIFSPEDIIFFQNEKVFLETISLQLPIQTPHLHESGFQSELPYLIMERLHGIPLKHLWDTLSAVEKQEIIRQLARTVKILHTLPVDLFVNSPWNWDAFMQEQKKNLLKNLQTYGLDIHWVSQLVDYVENIPIDEHNTSQLGPLHTEIMQEHLFLQKEHGHWTLSGLIDFEPSMVGHIEYEFSSVGLFITQGNKELFRSFLSAYGYHVEELNKAFSQRMMKWMLYHRYSNLKWFLTFVPSELHRGALEDLERFWFSF